MRKCEYCEFTWRCVYKEKNDCKDFDKFKIDEQRVEAVINRLEEQKNVLEKVLAKTGKVARIRLGRKLSTHNIEDQGYKEVFTFGGFTYKFVYQCFVEQYGENNAQRELNKILSSVKLGEVKEIFLAEHIECVDCDQIEKEV